MIIGYVLYGYDNDSYMYYWDKNMPVCDECGYKLNFQYTNPEFKLKRRVYDLSFTYDNCCIVSLKFKEFCERERYQSINFGKFLLEPNFFHFTANNIVQLKSVEGGIRFVNFCEKCKNYESIVFPGPKLINNRKEPLEDGFYRTDLFFGSGNEKNPLLIIGVDTYKKIKREKFKGLSFDEIKNTDVCL